MARAVIAPRTGLAFVAAIAVRKFRGVGPATAAKMERLGILTGADLTARSLQFLQQHFGKSGYWYFRIVGGIDECPVEPNRVRKSIGPEDTFVSNIFERDAARSELTTLVAKAGHRPHGHAEGEVC